MKMKKLKLILSAAALAILFLGCEKENQNGDINNPVPSEMTNGKTTALFNPNLTYGTLTDQDGNIYKTITIGSQTWMAENLRTTKYRDGSRINMSIEDWSDWTQGYFCEYNNTRNPDSIATYGRLYNWNALNSSRNIAPTGWRVPTQEDWETLIAFLGGGAFVGGKLKEIGVTHWNDPNLEANNESGFTALPGGYRADNGGFLGMGQNANFWTNLELSSNSGQNFNLSAGAGGVGSYLGFKSFGFSLRLIKE
jgi:uncharacterized protein (TIGR02145 family)